MRTKEEILDEIRRTTKENGGVPLGFARFQNESGINPYDWGKFWARFGDAVKEAGFEPNKFNQAYPEELFIQKLIGIIRKLGKFPTTREIQVEKAADPELPDRKAFQRLGTQRQLIQKTFDFCKDKSEYADVVTICEIALEKGTKQSHDETNDEGGVVGEVYLFKSGRYYKIGKTNDAVRRGNELRIQLPEKMDLIHSIKTDDPSGVEAYWHRRFESKRMNGEWFDLNSADIKTFKRWRRIY